MENYSEELHKNLSKNNCQITIFTPHIPILALKEEKKDTELIQSTADQTASDLASQNVGESPKSKPSETENSKSATSENTDTPVSQSNESDNSPEDPQDDGDKA